MESSRDIQTRADTVSDGKQRIGGRQIVLSCLYGLLLSVCLVLGSMLEEDGYLTLNGAAALRLVLTFVITSALSLLSFLLGERISTAFSKRKHAEKPETWSLKKSFLLDWLLLVLLVLPVFLAEYPGFFVYDAHDELDEVLTRTFTAHHPLLHVLLLGGTIALVHKITGSWNAGIAIYTLLQLLVITAVFSLVLQVLRKKRVLRWIRVLCLLFLGLFPTVVMYLLCSAKDGLFSAFLLLLTVLLYLLYQDPKQFLGKWKYTAALVLSALFMMLFRHNGFYSYLVFVPFGILFLPHGQKDVESSQPEPKRKVRSLRLRITALLLLPVVLYLGINTGMTKALTDPDTREYQEMLTVPISQLARAYNYSREVFTEEDIEILHRYLPEENLNKYDPLCTDLLKIGFDNSAFSEDKASFLKLWLRIGKRAPAVYLNAWLLTSYGYWYPYASLNVYAGRTVYTFTYDESSYFGYEVEIPGERHSFIPAIDSFYQTISLTWSFQKIPVIRLFFAPAFWFFVFVWQIFFRGFRRRFRGAIVFLPVFLTWLTVLLGPCSLVRYVIVLWFLVPVYFLPFRRPWDASVSGQI